MEEFTYEELNALHDGLNMLRRHKASLYEDNDPTGAYATWETWTDQIEYKLLALIRKKMA
jgi:hypothetical protein